MDRCRLVSLLGIGGIGKTTLAIKLVQQVTPHFDCVLWRSLYNAPSLEEVLHDWIPILSEQRYPSPPQTIEQSLALLIGLLQERRCLLVLDNLETLFQQSTYRQGYEDYGTLIQLVAQTTHQSCLLLTSRELFLDVGVIPSSHTPVRIFRVPGLDLVACQQLLHEKRLLGEQEDWHELVQRYADNPLALKVVAEMIQEIFAGNIAAFLAQGVTAFRGVRQLLTQQFERLSPLEQTLMYWLAVEREPISLEALQADQRYPASKIEVIEAMHSLRNRSLVERGERGAVFTLQPLILEYVTERLVTLIRQEIEESRPVLLLTHALLQAQAKDYLRASQARLILQPVLDQLVIHFGNRERLEKHFDILLQQLRALPRSKQAYGGGNVINLLTYLNGHVKGKDCSQLTIWQAHLQKAEAQDANFSGSDLTSSVFLEPIGGIVSVALSADGQYVACGSNNGEIHLWRATNGQLLLALQGHIRQVWSLAFHPESTRLVSGGYDGLVKVWEVSSGQCVSILQGHHKWVRSVAVHPEGRLLATCSDDGSLRLWDLPSGCCISIWHEQASGIWSVAFSPGGRLLACGDVNGMVKLWDLESRQCLWSVKKHHGFAVRSLTFSPDGELLVSGGRDRTIMVGKASNGESLSVLSGHTDAVQSVAFNNEGLLASGSQDHTVKLWKVGQRGETAQCLGTLQSHQRDIWSITFGPDRLLVSGDQDSVKIWQINREGDGGRCLRTLHGFTHLINAIEFSPDGRLLVSSEQNGTMRVWETKSGQCLRVLSRYAGGSPALAFCPDGQLFAHAFSENNTIKVWDIASGQCLRTLQGHQGQIWSVAFSCDGRFLVSGCLDTTIKLWEVSSGQCLTTLEGHSNWVWSVAWSPDGRLLASGDVSGTIKLWEMGSRQCLYTLQGSPQAVVALTFLPDGQTLLSSNAQDLVTVWDVKSGCCLKTVPGSEETYWLRSVAVSADSHFLAATSSDQTVKVWNVSTGELLRTFPCHGGRPWVVALSTDQQFLASATHEGTIILWNLQTGKLLMTLRGERPYERMNISHVTGITEAQKVALRVLGAIEEEDGMKH